MIGPHPSYRSTSPTPTPPPLAASTTSHTSPAEPAEPAESPPWQSYSSGSSVKSASSPSYSTTDPAPSAPLPPGVPLGLINLGNTCYMDASLQSLYSIEPFRRLILASGRLNDSEKVLTNELAELFKIMSRGVCSPSSSAGGAISPANFKYAFSHYQSKFSGFGQQDAQEFLRYLINGVHEESNSARRRTCARAPSRPAPRTSQEAWAQYREIVDDSPLVDLLVGQLCSTITCGQCQQQSHCWDPFWDLSLPLSARRRSPGYSSTFACSLRELLDEFTAKETLDSDERPVCSSCQRATRSTKQISLTRLPEVLILHLKKFSNDGYKLTSPEVQVDKQLALSGATYQLKAVVSHHGHSSCSGHYTAECEYSARWFHFNDDRVREVTATFDSNKLADAYVLLYMRARRPSISQSKL